MTDHDLGITAVSPALGVPGGEVRINCRGFTPDLPNVSKVLLGEVEAEIVSASEERVIARLVDSPNALGVSLRVGSQQSAVFPFTISTRLATGLHPVTSPVVASDGTIITTESGSRGQQIAQPLVKVSRLGEITRCSCEITNPTGLAFGPDGQLYVSSRNDGVVFRYVDFDQLEVLAEDLGIACGIAFDSRGRMFVGDRSGKIYRLDQAGGREEFAVLEPSISAYHLAVDAADRLYVTGPTLSMRDSLYRISREGRVEIVFKGLARAQGMAILPDGDILIATAYAGKKGVFKFSPATATVEHYIAAPTLVGIAVAGDEIILADNASIYRIQDSRLRSKLI